MSDHTHSEKMKSIFIAMDNERRKYCKSNYEWLLRNVLRIKPEEDNSIIENWKLELEILNNVIAEQI